MSEKGLIPELTRERWALILILFACVIISFVLRVLPWFQMDLQGFALYRDPDVWYNYRQIEVMIGNFPQYNWFDPMTAYPSGKHIDWGPLFPLIVSVICLITGAVQRVGMIMVSFWIPAVIGLLMIPVVFLLARQVAGWKAGILSAIMMAFISGDYFYRTMGGVVDHHCAEVLFTTLFCLAYISALRLAAAQEVDLKNPASYKKILLPSFASGVALAAGLAVVPTTILFALIVAIYTPIQYASDLFRNRSTGYLFVTNAVVSGCAIAGLALVGTHSPVYSLSTYSAAPFHAFILLFFVTGVLQVMAVLTKGKPLIFLVLMILSVIAGVGVASVVNPTLIHSGTGAIGTLFGQSFWEFPIEEQRPWSLLQMWTSYNIAIALALIGSLLLAYRLIRKDCPAHLFVLVWGAMVIAATVQHSRFEYYSAVYVAVSSAVALGYFLSFDGVTLEKKSAGKHSADKKGKKKRDAAPQNKNGEIFSSLQGTGSSFVLACMVIFCGVSILYDYSISQASRTTLIPGQWIGALEWMEEGTPDPGISYTGPYLEEGWEYPQGTYGVLSWWDYGHWITFLSMRIPVTNPFQDNVIPSSRYFFSESEDSANRIADEVGARYIVTDWKMVGSKFPAMVIWYNSSLHDQPLPENYYYQPFYLPQSARKDNTSLVTLYTPGYYQTMVSRLHNFDGTQAEPSEVVYLEYRKPEAPQGLPVVSVLELMDPGHARERLEAFEPVDEEESAAILNTGTRAPAGTLDALRHYRLVYEEAEEGSSTSAESVKVFEYVRGARMRGTGWIEVTVQTNLGRTFVYRQEAENGTFILPYSTTATYPVRTVGPYRILSSGKSLEVSEGDVLEGNTI